MLEHWYAALRSVFGCVIRTDDPPLTIQRMYAARKKIEDPALDDLSIVRSPTAQDELWVLKRNGTTQVERETD